MIDDLSAVKNFIGVSNVHHPNPETYDAYRALVPIYIRLSRQLQSEYKNIAEYQRTHVHQQDTKKK